MTPIPHTHWNPHPTTAARARRDWQKATAAPPWTLTPNGPFWRVAYVVVFGWRRWAIYRNGVRMWAKRTLPEALDYIARHPR